jgi:hypothetical protein
MMERRGEEEKMRGRSSTYMEGRQSAMGSLSSVEVGLSAFGQNLAMGTHAIRRSMSF